MSKAEQAYKDFLAVWERVDQDKVAEAILNEPLPLSDFDFKDAKNCVFTAAQKWLVRDTKTFSITGFEELIETDVQKAFLDIRGVVKSDDDFPALQPYIGRPFVLDWKTSKGALDKRWQDRYTDSWQWKIYTALAIPTPDLFIYRGVKRVSDNEPAETREVIIDTSKYARDVVSAAERTTRLVRAQIENLIQIGETPWPQNMPSSCFAYNRECPYYQDCSVHVEPGGNIEPRRLSYTRMKTFMECPERYRRGVLDNEAGLEEDDNEDTKFGSAVHRGLESVWSQVFKEVG